NILITPVVVFATCLSLIIFWLNIRFIPHLNTLRNEIAAEHQVLALKQMFQPGEFHKVGDNNLVIYIDSYGKGNQLNNVFLYANNITSSDRINFILAKRANVVTKDDLNIELKLFEGIKYIVFDNELIKINFKEYSRFIVLPTNSVLETDEPSTSHLIKSDK